MVDHRISRVEIVTPVHNRKAITLQCLRSLMRLDMEGLYVHVIVVDDGSTDGTGDAIAAEFPWVEVIRGDGSLFYTKGTNRGFVAAMVHAPDFILAINDDSIFHESSVRRLVECAIEHPRSVVGGLLLDWSAPHRVFQVGARWDTWYGGWRHPAELTAFDVPRSAWQVEVIVGNCVLYPTAAIEEVGLMNEKAFPFGFGDAEFTPRMRRHGWRLLIEPSAYVWCQPNAEPTSLKRLSWRERLREVLVDFRSPRNVRRLFLTRWHSAPSRRAGVIAFVVFVVRWTLHGMGLGGDWPSLSDPPLGEEVNEGAP